MSIKTKIIYICIAVAVLLLSWAVFFGMGLYYGRCIAEKSIKSELIWYNQSMLQQAIVDMRDGKLDDAENTILYVNNELNRMKNVHNGIGTPLTESPSHTTGRTGQ